MPRSSSRKLCPPIAVVTAADDRYAMPLAVMVRSLLDNLGRERQLLLYVLDGGIRPANKRKVLASWDLEGVKLEWVRPRMARLKRLHVTDRFGIACYYRILVPEILPPWVRKAVYLDADTLVLDDVGKLWETDLRGQPLGAVRDPVCPTVSGVLPNYEALGIPSSAKYFNSGVLLMDLERWRAEGIGERILEYAEAAGEHLLFADQDALNALLAGKWLELSPRWNAALNFLWTHRMRGSLAAKRSRQKILEQPGILHFLAGPKPWQPGAFFHRKFLFFHYLDRTQWAGWRPADAPVENEER